MRALSYEECDIVHNVYAVESTYTPCLDRVLEHDGLGRDLSISLMKIAIKRLDTSNFNWWFVD